MNSSPVIWLDGELTRDLPLPDRGFEFGDGLFETLLLRNSRPVFLDTHLERLACGLACLGFPPVTEVVVAQLQRALDALASQLWEWGTLRITVTRGAGPRGYAPPAVVTPRVVIQAVELPRDAGRMIGPAHLGVATIRLPTQPALAGLKHLNRLEQVMAASEASKLGRDELLMLDQAGHVVSVVAGNLFIVRDETIVTPPLLDCGVAGTRRRLVIEHWASHCGFQVAESTLTLADVQGADEVFYSNSLVTVRSVAQLDDTQFRSRAVADALFAHFLGTLA